jgi:hypothetical protein
MRMALKHALLFLTIFFTAPALAGNYIPARITEIEGDSINDLKWESDYSRIISVNSGAGYQYTAQLFGVYHREGWTLHYHDQKITLNDRGGFRVEIAIDRLEKIYFEFEAKGPKGETEHEKIELNRIIPKLVEGPPRFIDGESGLMMGDPKKRFFIVPGIAYSSISVNQVDADPYSTSTLTGKISINYRLVPQVWDFGFSAFGTLLQLSKSSDVTCKFLGINTRFGYMIPNISTEWFLSLYAGWYYTSTFVSDNSFGYKNLSGPQIYPSIKRVLGTGDVLAFYFKYSPIASSLSLLQLSNREIASGISYTRLLPHDRSIGASFDISGTSITLDELTNRTNTWSLGLQYGF